MIIKNFKKLTLTFLIFTSIPSFAVDKVIDGGAGTDSLTINYSGITSLSNFDISTSGDSIVLTDSSSNTISFRLISSLIIGSNTYVDIQSNSNTKNFFWSSSEHKIYMYEGGKIDLTNYSDSLLPSYSLTSALPIVGSSLADTVLMENVDRSNLTGAFTFSMGDGDDLLPRARLINADSIDMGAGDDNVELQIGSSGTSAFDSVSYAKLDGGSGSDTLDFTNSISNATNGKELTLTFGGATNFENIVGAGVPETIKGDGNNNILVGDGDKSVIGSSPVGSDTIYGFGGNDLLVAGSGNLNDFAKTSRIASEAVFISYRNDSDNTGNDNLYGGSGDDVLVGSRGDNILDGGTDADTIYSGNGSDTIVIRSGDGGSTKSTGDTVSDFTDGTDSIGLDTITFGALTIAQVGSDTVIKEGSNFLTTLTGISASNITAVDFQSTSTSAVTYNGTSGNDTMVGGAGGDTFNGGAGSDTLLGWGGNDTFNIRSKSGSFADTINGGAGTDTLNISYSGVSDLGDFVISVSGDNTILTDSSGGIITFSSIESLIIGSNTYVDIQSNSNTKNFFWSSSEHKIYMYEGGKIDLTNYSDSLLPSYSLTSALPIVGSSLADTVLMENVDRSNLTGAFTFSMGDGDDLLPRARLINADSIDMGAGDDNVELQIGSSGTSAFDSVSYAKLDGGSGSDTLDFTNSISNATNGKELTLTFGGATNFENIVGAGVPETIKGDGNNNILVGDGDKSVIGSSPVGSDTIYGFGGNDLLVAGSGNLNDFAKTSRIASEAVFISYRNDSDNTGNDNLYGGSGDDVLVGSRGDNILDGGTDADTIYSGNGSDTIVIRSGDGGSSITDADVLSDFSDTDDTIGMDGLEYSQLTVEQGTGDYSNHVVVKITDTGEFLLIIQSTSLSSISNADFSAI